MKRHHVLIGAVVTGLLLVTGLTYAQGTAPEREMGAGDPEEGVYKSKYDSTLWKRGVRIRRV